MDDRRTGIEPSIWAQTFGGSGKYRAKVIPEGVEITTSSKSRMLSFKRITKIDQEDGFFWSTIKLTLEPGKSFAMGGIPIADATTLRYGIEQTRKAYLDAVELFREHKGSLKGLAEWLRKTTQGQHWVAHHQIMAAVAQAEALGLGAALVISPNHLSDDTNLVRSAGAISRFLANPEGFREKTNACFVAAELQRFRDYFDTVESNPLTEAQRRAIITHEDNTRVIAGAGSGKTSVVVAKAGYLLTKGLCKPSQLLLLAFNRAAADEMSERIQARVGIKVRATTFHALGLSILGQVEGRKPSLAKSAESEAAMVKMIRALITDLILDPLAGMAVQLYFRSFFAPEKGKSEFATPGDYYAYLKNHILTLKREQVKSFEEAEIANFLCLHGIGYVYEPKYEIDLADKDHRQYQPDFHLPDYGIYIEHFGIARDGSTAPQIDQLSYTVGMEWKRQVHREHGTTLIETYSYEKREGVLLQQLESKLRKHGVNVQPISREQLIEVLEQSEYIDPFSRLVATFLNHFKGGAHTVDGVRDRAKALKRWSLRLDAFLKVFEPLLERYEARLGKDGDVDFNDMILRAAHYAESGRYHSPYTCILVDEFQDISVSRARLVKGLSDQQAANRLFCVGDDWQAIYRFAGSDIALMRDFDEHFGYTASVALDRTFRFNDRIERVATRFVLANPAQIKKTIQTNRQEAHPRVTIHRPSQKGEDVFAEALRAIQRHAGGDDANVLVLGRYSFLRDNPDWGMLRQRFPSLRLDFKTIHGAKGLEADYVVVLGMQSGKYGFPSEITDDPILDAVLSAPEGFAYAEERRLFYVALTRARHGVHLIADYALPSLFIAELLTYAGEIQAHGNAARIPAPCPACRGGTLVNRSGQYGAFIACSNYPLCTYTTKPCPKCGVGVLLRKTPEFYVCNNEGCRTRQRACPCCDDGRLVQRNGRNGQFLGCTNYRSGKCTYTENLN